jgi:CubicO group peptidase (beta-lactamase class C family)
MSDVPINGFCDERFASVRAAFEKNFALDLELGATFALAIEGEFVVDLRGGFTDEDRTTPWREDTIVGVSSSAKVPAAICGLMAVDRGLIELDAPVADYWPEFAAAGKENVTVRQVFSHASGVAGFDPPTTWRDLLDWDVAVSRLAAQAPWWEPGTACGYHAMTFMFLIGELVRRVTGASLGRFLREEVTQKIEADFFLGLPESAVSRLADSVAGQMREMDEDSFLYRTTAGLFAAEEGGPAVAFSDPRWSALDVNGFGNAKSMVKLGSILANGGSLYGHEFMSNDTVRLAGQEQMYTHDPYFGAPARYGLGVGLDSKEFPLHFDNAMHWGGFGGSTIVMEPDSRSCWSYVPSNLDPALAGDARGRRLSRAAIAGVQALS